MYMLIEGKVRIDRPLPGGGMALLAEAEAPSVIGEMALIDDRERTATVTTVSDSVMLQLPKATFSALREEFSPAAYKLIRRLALTLCERLEEKTERIVHFFEEQQLRG
jgi:CRP-like cAMP-binding protein